VGSSPKKKKKNQSSRARKRGSQKKGAKPVGRSTRQKGSHLRRDCLEVRVQRVGLIPEGERNCERVNKKEWINPKPPTKSPLQGEIVPEEKKIKKAHKSTLYPRKVAKKLERLQPLGGKKKEFLQRAAVPPVKLKRQKAPADSPHVERTDSPNARREESSQV